MLPLRKLVYAGMFRVYRDRAYAEIGAILTKIEPHRDASLLLNASRAVEPLVRWLTHDIRTVQGELEGLLVALDRQNLEWLIDWTTHVRRCAAPPSGRPANWTTPCSARS